MPVKKINKVLYECTCLHEDCVHHTEPWTTDEVPERCAGCKRRTWNRPSRINRETLTYDGRTLSIAQWARELGVTRTTISWRIKQGWPLHQVLSKDDWRFGES